MSAELTMRSLALLLASESNDYRFTITKMAYSRGSYAVTVEDSRTRKTFTGSAGNADQMIAFNEALTQALDRATRYRDACNEEEA